MNFLFCVTRRAMESEDQEPEHIKGSECRCNQSHSPENLSVNWIFPFSPEDCVFAEETGKGRKTGYRNRSHQKRAIGPWHLVPEAAHLANVLKTSQAVNHASRSEEEQSLEERMRHQMENACCVRAGAASQKHE